MPGPDWEKWIPIVETNRLTLERMEKKVDEIHDVVYKNGLSMKVNTLWGINKIVLSIITAIFISVIVYFITNPGNDETNKRLNKIETMIEQIER